MPKAVVFCSLCFLVKLGSFDLCNLEEGYSQVDMSEKVCEFIWKGLVNRLQFKFKKKLGSLVLFNKYLSTINVTRQIRFNKHIQKKIFTIFVMHAHFLLMLYKQSPVISYNASTNQHTAKWHRFLSDNNRIHEVEAKVCLVSCYARTLGVVNYWYMVFAILKYFQCLLIVLFFTVTW